MKMTSPSVALQTGMELEQPYDNSRATTITKMIDKPSAVGKDDFLAKKSGSYKTNIADDRDVWCEYLAVVEMAVPANSGTTKNKDKELYELHIKSFFESSLTGKRTWDEPPSGATTIQYASDDDHQRAEDEKMALQTTTRPASDNAQPKERRLSKLNVFRKWRNRKNRQGSSPDQLGRRDIKHKTTSTNNSGVARKKTLVQKQQELNLDEQDAIAMAQALSLSERDVDAEREREDAMMDVLYESKTGAFSGATGLAYAGGGVGGEDGPLDILVEEEDEGKFEQGGGVGMEGAGAFCGKSADENNRDLKMPAA